MIGAFVLGTAFAFLAWRVARHRHAHCHAYAFRHGFHGGFHGGWRDPVDDSWEGVGRSRRRSFLLERLLADLDVTPAQERIVSDAVVDFRRGLAAHEGELRRTRADLAAAFRKPAFDEVLLGELFARQDRAIEAIRKDFVGLVAKTHEALDERQRARLADRLESGFFRRFRGWM